MSQNHVRLAVLRASLRCARHRRAPDRAALLLRVDCSASELDAALAELADEGLVRSARDGRLTFAGLAVAVASLPPLEARAARRPRARSAA